MSDGIHVNSSGEVIVYGDSGVIVSDAGGSTDCCCTGSSCYQRWTVTYTCGTGWGTVTASYKHCYAVASPPSTVWKKTGSTGSPTTGTCSYEIFVPMGHSCTVDGDCAGFTNTATPSLPYAGGTPPDCCCNCDCCPPADPTDLPYSIDNGGMTPPTLWNDGSTIDPIADGGAEMFDDAGTIAGSGGTPSWEGDGNILGVDTDHAPCIHLSVSCDFDADLGRYVWHVLVGRASVNLGCWNNSPGSPQNPAYDIQGELWDAPLSCVAGEPSGTCSVPMVLTDSGGHFASYGHLLLTFSP